MLDRTDFASWKQRIRLYCRGKENGVNILKSIDEGPFQMGTIRDSNCRRDRRYNADIQATNILLQGLPKDIYTLINHYTEAKDIWDNVKMLLEGSELTKEDRKSQLYDDFEHFRQNKGETIHDYYVRFVIAVKLNRGLKDSNYDQLYAYLKQHEVKQGRLSVTTATTMFMENLSSADHVYDEASPCYDSDILSEVHNNDHYQDAVCEHHEVHEIHDDVQPNYDVDSHTDYTSDSNMIPYDQYVKDNAVPVV
ncbi:hypothetical protein Tco_1285822 [Tanacetum coccineum]